MERPVTTGEFPPLHPGSDQPGASPADAAGTLPDPSDAPVAESPRPGGPVIIELLGGNGQVRYRTRLTTLPAVVGRAYDADVLIDDPHVCARHAELRREEDGSLVLVDLSSINGIGRARGERLARVELASGDRARLGPVEIRVVEATHPVPAAVPVSESRGMTTGIQRPGRALVVCAGALIAFALLNYQGSVDSDGALTAIQEGVYILAGVALWASAWSLATRLVSKNFRFLSHWAWSLGILLAGLVLTTIGEWLDFIGPSIEAGSWLTTIGVLAMLPVLIAGHLEIASAMSGRRRWRAALSVGGIVIALVAISSLDDDGMRNTWSLEFSGSLKPLPERLVPAMSLERFMDETAALQAEVDAMAEEEPDDDSAIVPLIDAEVGPDSSSVLP